MMKLARLLPVAAFLAAAWLTTAPSPARAQAAAATVVSACGSQSLPVGATRAQSQDPPGGLCVTVAAIAAGVGFNLTGINGTAPGPSNPLYVYPNIAYAPTDASTTVATGGTFQTVFASNTSRINCFIENPTTATEPLYVHWTSAGATTANSASLGAGASFSCAGNNAVVTALISVTATTTGHAFMAAGS